MLLLVSHTHTPERCPGVKSAESGKEFLKSISEEIASKEKVKIIGSYIAPTEHTIWLVLEADSLKSVENFTFESLANVGSNKITPVMTINQALG